MQKDIKESSFGIYLKIKGKSLYFDSKDDKCGIEIRRNWIKTKKGNVGRVQFRNVSQSSIRVNSIVLADFILPQSIVVREVLEQGWLCRSKVRFKSPREYTYPNRFFLRSDQNGLSFRKDFGHINKSIVSDWFTIVRLSGKSLVIGAVTTADQFTAVYVKQERGNIRVRVACQFDGLIMKPGEVLKSEKIAFLMGNEKETLKSFATLIARNMKIGRLKKPIRAMTCAYAWNKNVVTEKIVKDQLSALKNMPDKIKLDYFQVDAGYSRYWGDWFDVRERFPAGLEALVKLIKDAGYRPSIWIAPTLAHKKSRLFRDRQEWFLKDNNSNPISGSTTSPFDPLISDLNYSSLDPTKDEVLNHIRSVFMKFRTFGFELYKIDFLYPVCLSTNYEHPMTRAQALNKLFRTIRSVVGSKAHILAAISPLSSLVGFADSVRTGNDSVNPFFLNYPFLNEKFSNYYLNESLKKSELRIFLNNVVWTNDLDALVLDKRAKISRNYINKHIGLIKKNNTSRWIADDLTCFNKDQNKTIISFYE